MFNLKCFITNHNTFLDIIVDTIGKGPGWHVFITYVYFKKQCFETAKFAKIQKQIP